MGSWPASKPHIRRTVWQRRRATCERSAPLPDDTAYWLFTKTELNNPTTTLHREGCPILRHSQRRTRGVLTGPITWAQVAALPDEGYQACGRCKPAASSAPAH